MQGTTVQQFAEERAEELPAAALTHPFGPDWEVYKVRDKVFMLLTDITGESIDEQLVDDLVTESYLLVVEKNLPKDQQPVDPHTFAQGTSWA